MSKIFRSSQLEYVAGYPSLGAVTGEVWKLRISIAKSKLSIDLSLD
ncbi:hypothetical protein QT971_13405 [Microcoleus sp. herbarium19]